ncbi:type II toxin-antitoxin system VapC family toxin [Nocardia sp. NPDC058497]|uniref:type II toxin-antitoxin system VapC family toxin n=1 Tax=Nocardia sp. NPDC058497 TaxID=3346529 RepID=UPI00365DC571
MSYLIDTNVLSELMRQRPAAAVLGWFERNRGSEQWLSVITVGELRRGIALLRARTESARADRLERAVDEIEGSFTHRILPVDTAVAHQWALIATTAIDVSDGLIAATALTHGHTVATRNTKHFAHTGVALVNPFELPSDGPVIRRRKRPGSSPPRAQG